MSQWISHARNLLFEVPRNGKLAYCLLLDERVPAAPKAALAGTVGLIVSPFDLPAWIPVIGELDMLALGVLAVKVFIEACPREIVREHEDLIATGESRFDRDFKSAVRGARRQARLLLQRSRREVADQLRRTS